MPLWLRLRSAVTGEKLSSIVGVGLNPTCPARWGTHLKSRRGPQLVQIRSLFLTSFLIVTGGMAERALAGEIQVASICPLALNQARTTLEERELDTRLAGTELEAAREIFELITTVQERDPGSVTRLGFLAAQRGMQVAELDLTRQQLLVKRDQAALEQTELVCAAISGGEKGAESEQQLADARARYLQADCHRIGKDLAIAEIEVSYYEEVLASIRDLRINQVATQQDLIRARRDLQLAEQRVTRQAQRVEACIASGAAGGV